MINDDVDDETDDVEDGVYVDKYDADDVEL